MKFEPLWVRVERNRVKLAVFMLVFALMWALAALVLAAIFTIVTIIVVAVITMRATSMFGETVMPLLETVWTHLSLAILSVAGVGVASSVIYAARVLATPPLMKLMALGARRPDQGEYPATKHALRDMAIAAGLSDKLPHLFVIESSSVNAFMLARGDERAYCVVTSALANRFELDEQRAVFANLMVRLRAGDIQWGTVVSALMAPIWRWRDFGMRAENDELASVLDEDYVAGDRTSRPAYAGAASEAAIEGSSALGLIGPVWVAYVAAVVASELVALGHRRSHLLAAEAADAEGMFLLKDPTAMLRTLKHAIEADNRMRVAAPLYAHLFYIWAGDDCVDEDDPEWRRLKRLREVIGLFGIEDAARGEDLVVTGLPPVAPRGVTDPGTLPSSAETRIEIPYWARFVPLVVGLVAEVLAGGRLFQVAAYSQPLVSRAQDPAQWAAYERVALRAENGLFVVAIVSTLFSAIAVAYVWGAVASVGAHALFLVMFDVLAQSVGLFESGRVLGGGLGVAFAAVVIAGAGGAMLGSLVWGTGRTG